MRDVILDGLAARAEERGMKPLSEIKASDPRTFAKRGGIPAYVRYLHVCLLSARTNVPPCPHESDVIEDRLLASDLDHALSRLLSLASALGVDLTEETP